MSVIQGEVMLPGEWTPTEAAAYVNDAYAKSVEAVIETGARLIECKKNLGHGNWLPFVGLLHFSEQTARYLMQIAMNPAIANRHHGGDLPSSWRTLSVLAQLPPAEIEARITAGEITPETTRAEAEQWARVHQAARQEAINAWTEAVDGLTRQAHDPWEIDHMVPVARGGTNHAGNLALCHRTCNRDKGTL